MSHNRLSIAADAGTRLAKGAGNLTTVMKNSFPSLLLIAAAAFPCSLLAAIAGLPWPAALDAGHTFGAFVAVLILLIAFADYARRPAPLRAHALPTTAVNASFRRATAGEERRLAA